MPDTGCLRAAKRNRSVSPGGSGRTEALGCLARRLEREEDIETVGVTPTTAVIAGDMNSVDCNSVDREISGYGIVGDTLMTAARSMGMGTDLDIVDSTGMGVDGDAPVLIIECKFVCMRMLMLMFMLVVGPLGSSVRHP